MRRSRVTFGMDLTWTLALSCYFLRKVQFQGVRFLYRFIIPDYVFRFQNIISDSIMLCSRQQTFGHGRRTRRWKPQLNCRFTKGSSISKFCKYPELPPQGGHRHRYYTTQAARPRTSSTLLHNASGKTAQTSNTATQRKG